MYVIKAISKCVFPPCRLTPREFNSYGSRRGNDAAMARGTFANIRLFNKFLNKQAPRTIYLPSGDMVQEINSYIMLDI